MRPGKSAAFPSVASQHGKESRFRFSQTGTVRLWARQPNNLIQNHERTLESKFISDLLGAKVLNNFLKTIHNISIFFMFYTLIANLSQSLYLPRFFKYSLLFMLSETSENSKKQKVIQPFMYFFPIIFAFSTNNTASLFLANLSWILNLLTAVLPLYLNDSNTGFKSFFCKSVLLNK